MACGQFIRSLNNLLDPQRSDSIQASFNAALKSAAAPEGELQQATKMIFAQELKPLADEVVRLGNVICGDEAALKALENTTLKGKSFEEEVVKDLQAWGKTNGAEVFHVGGDNKPGDVLVKFTTPANVEPSITLELKDRPSKRAGRKEISVTMASAMAEWSADCGIYLCRTQDGLTKEVGDWALGQCENREWLATTSEFLYLALMTLRSRHQLRALRDANSEIDAERIEAELQNINTTMRRVSQIKSDATHAHKSIDHIKSEADQLLEEVKLALAAIQDSLSA